MTVDELLQELERLGSESTVKTFRRHGANGKLYGVKVGDLKKLVKYVKGNHDLALQLWDTDVSDAMYLASLAANGKEFTRKQLDHWAKTAWWYMLSEYAVPFVAAEHPDACILARKWIRAKATNVASSGWSTYTAAISIRPDDELDLDEIRSLLALVEDGIDKAAGRVRYCMNGFVIGVGSYVKPLLGEAKATAKALGTVHVDMGETDCRVPVATDTIKKIESMKRVGKKRKTAKC
ncbi:MAG: DNA alkylation repair protein [Planctomycetales bacterium]|nr:DNA alkylation repair protein [Planctomycetales bacterium]